MMHRKIYQKIALMICMTLIFVLTGCSQAGQTADQAADTPAATPAAAAPEPTAAPAPEPAHMIECQIESQAVADNMLDEPSAIEVRVYLPPSYFAEPERRYPVVYFLHGYSDNPGLMTVPGLMNIYMKDSKEFIIVEPSGHNSLGGSFFVNSPVTGRWEDFITHEVIDYIDGNYRTIADRGSRGIAGFSMGGFGAVNLALTHPDLYGCMLAYSPGLLRDGDLEGAFDNWDSHFERAYGAAFSPNLEGGASYANIPQFDGTEADGQIIEDWLSGFGDIDGKIDAYLALDQPLSAIQIIVGTQDYYPWIPEGCRAFAERMEELGQTMTLKEHSGGHAVPMNTLKEDFIEFFADNLEE